VIAVIAGAVVVVALLAALTPTVIVDNHHERHGVRAVRGDWAPFPGPPRWGYHGGTRPAPPPSR
jgi:hypothetical protein